MSPTTSQLSNRIAQLSAVLLLLGGCRDASKSVDTKGSTETAQVGEDKLDEAEELALKKVAESLRNIVAKHQARFEGEISVTPRGEYQDIYTVDLQDALITDPPQPIVCVASMLDVARRDSGYETTLVFHHIKDLPDGGEFSYSVVLVLTCETDVATSVIEKGTGGTTSIELARRVESLKRLYGKQEVFDLSEYIVVATISNVFKPTFATTGTAIGDAESERQVRLELDSGTTFVAHGECVELVPIFELLDGK